MSDLKLNDDGDLDITNADVSLTSGRESYRQRLQIRYRSFLGEYFLNTDYGIPWFQSILKKQPDYVTVQQVLKNAALSMPGVIELTRFDIDFTEATRLLTVSLAARTEEGEIDLTEIVSV